jgi:glycosyltransferase involved in cell wall biosynthesis
LTAISIVVPTRDRPDRLAVCLAALERQTAADMEIVVVDDASRDSRAVAEVVAAAPRAQLVRGEGRGPAAARNRGVRAAEGAIVCFTDDDCEPVPEWAAALAARIQSSADVHAAAGPTRNARPENPFAAAAQTIASHLAEATIDAPTGRMRFAPTSNLACRAEVLAAVPFDERYPLAAGEDRDWCARLVGSGRSLVFEPTAIVRHHQELGPRTFWRQQVRYGRGAYRFRADHGTLTRPEPPAFYAGLVRRGFTEGRRAGALVCLAQAATAWGLGIEAVTDRRTRAER